MDEDTSRICAEAADRASGAIPHIASAMVVGRTTGWSASDLRHARDKLADAMRLVTDAIGLLSE